jgi:endonuclease-8
MSPRPELEAFCADISGRRVRNVTCRGKNIFIFFEGDWVLHNHLLMQGRWRKHPGPFLFPPADAWLLLDLGVETICNYRGQMLKALRTRDLPQLLARIGPDAMDPAVSDEQLAARIRESSLSVGEALLDQECISGVGNVARSEALFWAGVLPGRDCAGLSPGVALRVIQCARRVLADSYAAGGRWIHRVYKRAGQPCIRCGATIRRDRLAPSNRSIYFCPRCQR